MKKIFESNQNYSEGSGVCTYYDNNVGIKLNEYGYYEEYIVNHDKPLNENTLKISPSFNNETNEFKTSKELFGNQENVNHKKLLGHYLDTFIGHVSEGNFREKASSGGVGTWILKELLERDLVDAVIHVKRNKDKESPILFKYDLSFNIDEIREGAKTKYYPVEMSEVLKIVKSNPGRYAIVGIPSFIYAIRLLSKYDQDIKNRIVYTIGLICGHQKSTAFTDLMAWQQGFKPGSLTNLDYRVKFDDREASTYGVLFEGMHYIEGEKKIIKSNKELLGQDWGKGYFRLEASDYTEDVFNVTADITIGDAWLDEYRFDSDGNNIVIIRNKRISDIFKEEISKNNLNMDDVSEDFIFRSQIGHLEHTYDRLPYRLYLKEKENLWYPLKTQKPSKKIGYFEKKHTRLRMEISEKSHKYFLEAKQKNDINYFITKMSKYDTSYRRINKILLAKRFGIMKSFKRIFRKIFRKR